MSFTLNLKNAVRRFALAASVAFTFAPLASAVTLLDVTGPFDSGQSFDDGEAVTTSFVLASGFQNATVSAPVAGFGATGEVWLVKDQIGPGTTIGNVIAGAAYDSTVAAPSFTGLDLSAGTYFLILGLDSGFAVWPASLSPTVTLHPDAALGLDFRAQSSASFLPASDFDVVFGEGTLHLSVTADVAAVPEAGATGWLLLVSGLTLTVWRRFRTTIDEKRVAA